MQFTKLVTAGCLTAVLSAGRLLAQEPEVEIRLRAIADRDGKLEVVEERISGSEKPATTKPTTQKIEEEVERRLRSDKKNTDAKEPEETVRARVFRRLQDFAGGATTKGDPAGAYDTVWGELPHSDYWIGVQIAPVAPEVRKHMAVKHGILVLHVYPDSPAAKAELQADDVLLQAGDAKLETGPDLIKAVDAAQTKELKFKVLRDGLETTATLIPVKREEAKALTLPRSDAGPRLERLQAAQRQFEKALEALRAETEEDAAVDFMLVRPGAFMARAATEKMPDDLTIQVTKKGNEPARIRVVKGDKNWEVTADKLDGLPKEIRPFVEQVAGSSAQATTVMVAPHVAGGQPLQLKVPAPGMRATIPGPVVVPAPAPGPPTVYGVPGLPVAPLPNLPGVVPNGVVPNPGGPARAAITWSSIVPHSAADAKLDQILKKLDGLSSPDLEEMKKELQSLRREVDELRKKSTGSEASK